MIVLKRLQFVRELQRKPKSYSKTNVELSFNVLFESGNKVKLHFLIFWRPQYKTQCTLLSEQCQSDRKWEKKCCYSRKSHKKKQLSPICRCCYSDKQNVLGVSVMTCVFSSVLKQLGRNKRTKWGGKLVWIVRIIIKWAIRAVKIFRQRSNW